MSWWYSMTSPTTDRAYRNRNRGKRKTSLIETVVNVARVVSPIVNVAAAAANTVVAYRAIQTQKESKEAQEAVADAMKAREKVSKLELELKQQEKELLGNMTVDNRKVMAPMGAAAYQGDMSEIVKRAIRGHLGYDIEDRFKNYVKESQS